ncbi:MAG: winged-helix domain-containing protein [Nitrososphaeraceae archaeon]
MSSIAENLHNIGFDIAERAIRHRLGRIEKSGIILDYSAILDRRFISENNKVSKIALSYSVRCK